MIKKILVFVLSVFITLSCTACFNLEDELEPTVDDETTLTILGQKSHIETPYIKKIFDLYYRNTGKKIKPLAIDNKNFKDKAQKMFDEGKIPDLMFLFNDADLARFNAKDNFMYLNNEPWIDELVDSALEYSKDINGNVLGLPFWENSLSGCYYNKTILEELGLGPATTQIEFDRLCDDIKKLGLTPLYWAGTQGGNWMFQFGLDPVFSDNQGERQYLQKLNANEIKYSDIEEVNKMFEWFKKASDKGWFNEDYAARGWDDLVPAIGGTQNEEPKAVMFFVWDTWISELKNTEKQKVRYTEKDFGVMPVFMGTTKDENGNYDYGKGTYEGGNLNLMMVNKNGKKLQLALDFLKFCANPKNYNVAFDGVVTLPCFKGQNTNKQSNIVHDAIKSIEANLRPSTAWPKIRGYLQDDAGAAMRMLFEGSSIPDCLAYLDAKRLANETPVNK